MAPRTLTYTVAQVAAWVSKAAPEYAPFGLSAQLAWYQFTKDGCFGLGYHHKRFGNVKAAVSRNKREGKYLRNHVLYRLHYDGTGYVDSCPGKVWTRTGPYES